MATLAWHPDWPCARPSTWDSLPRIAEDPLDVPAWYHHGEGLLYSWRGYGYCRGCRMRVEAKTEDAARALLELHLPACRDDAKDAQPYLPGKRIARIKGIKRKPKVERHVDICGGCYARFVSPSRQEAADALRAHVEQNPCEHYAV
jgi:hypothetical protein